MAMAAPARAGAVRVREHLRSTSMPPRPLTLGLCFLLAALTKTPAEPPAATGPDEEALKAAGLGTGDAALLDLFRRLTPDDRDNAAIAGFIRDLGADDFAVRERASAALVKAGRKAAGPLRLAKGSRDVEVARRAEACLTVIEREQAPAVIAAAARLLAARRPAATAEALLAFAPFADDRGVLDSVRDALAAVAVRDGRPDPALTDALASDQPLRRGLAGDALVRTGQADAAPAVRKLLADADPRVRLRVGLAFVAKADPSAIPRLIELLAELPPEQTQAVEDLLGRLALGKSPEIPPGADPAARAKARDAWRAWWAANGAGIDLARLDRKPVVAMETSLGVVRIELDADKAPATVRNFIRYVEDRHYDGLTFHRVIPAFMIQGGGMEPGLKERAARAPIKNEAANGLSNKRGTVAMARTAAPDSATSQFFVNVKDNGQLDAGEGPGQAGYCVFGRVVGGMDVVDRIAAVRTGGRGGFQDVPVEDVVIKSARVVR